LRAVVNRRILSVSMKALTVVITAAISFSVHAATLPRQWQIADEPLADYFRRETRALLDK